MFLVWNCLALTKHLSMFPAQRAEGLLRPFL
jgi:hypothetical protein